MGPDVLLLSYFTTFTIFHLAGCSRCCIYRPLPLFPKFFPLVFFLNLLFGFHTLGHFGFLLNSCLALWVCAQSPCGLEFPVSILSVKALFTIIIIIMIHELGSHADDLCSDRHLS